MTVTARGFSARLPAAPALVLGLAAATTVSSGRALAQEPADTARVLPEFRDEISALMERPAVQEALRRVEEGESRTVEDQVALTEIPAPPFMEEERGRAFAERLREAGADSVFVDGEGNVIGIRRGEEPDPEERRTVVLSGHLDTVFPDGTDVSVSTRGDTLFAPGIGDDGRGLAVVLTVLRAMEEAGIRTRADVWFVGTVGEEGLGDLRGVKYLFREDGPRIDAFISIDGSRIDRIVHEALGSRRYRVIYEGPGGHSWGAFGLGNPAHALGRAIHLFDRRAASFVAEGERTSYNVGRVGGGTSVNSIPFEAWMEVDMRSVAQPRLMAIDSLFRVTVQEALEEQNAVRRQGPALVVNAQLVGDRPSGEIPTDEPLVQRAAAAARELGTQSFLFRSSTDANVPISRGVPAVTIGGGGEGGGAHSLDEWWRDPGDAYRGVQRALLLVLAEAGLP